jgi:hypothetical protein
VHCQRLPPTCSQECCPLTLWLVQAVLIGRLDRNLEVTIIRVCHNISTSNFHSHINSCNRKQGSNQATVIAFAQGSTYQKDLLHVYTALWAATSYHPFAIVKDDYFIKIVAMFNPKAKLPSESTVTCDIQNFFKLGQENLKAYFQVRLNCILHHWSLQS